MVAILRKNFAIQKRFTDKKDDAIHRKKTWKVKICFWGNIGYIKWYGVGQ